MSDFPIFGEKHQSICPKVQQISSRIKKKQTKKNQKRNLDTL